MYKKIFRYTNVKTNDEFYYRKNSNAMEVLGLTGHLISKKNKDGVYRQGDWIREKITDRAVIDSVNILDVGEVVTDKELPIMEDEGEYKKLAEEYIKEKAKVQYLRDKLRIERRDNRLEDRLNNANNALIRNISKGINEYDYTPQVTLNDTAVGEKYGVIQLSDAHFNEIVDFKENIYNFEVAERRLNDLFDEAIRKFKLEDITDVTLLFTGDMFNLDHIIDKLLTNEVTRAEALEKGFVIISKLIERLLNAGYTVNIASVLGNESRINGHERLSGIDSLALDNFDFLLILLLKTRFNNAVNFINDGSDLECMVKIGNFNLILAHGNNLKHSQLDTQIQNLKLRWYKITDIYADYVLFGHMHSSLITNMYARSASLVGGNGYSKNTLNIVNSFASQNILIVGDRIECTSVILK